METGELYAESEMSVSFHLIKIPPSCSIYTNKPELLHRHHSTRKHHTTPTSHQILFDISCLTFIIYVSFILSIPFKSIKAGCITETPLCIMQSTSCSCQNDLTVETTPSTSNQRFHEENPF